MRIILVGASGIIGREIDQALSQTHDIVSVGATSGDIQCNYTNEESVKNLFNAVGA